MARHGLAHEVTAREALLDPDEATPLLHRVEPRALAGDRGYSANGVRDRIAAVGWQPVIPKKRNERQVHLRECSRTRDVAVAAPDAIL